MSIAPFKGEVVAGVPLTLKVHPRARRLKLRFDEKSGGLTLTVPPRTSRRVAIEWATSQAKWVTTQLARQPGAQPLTPGATIPFDGEEVRLAWAEGTPRIVRREGDALVSGGPRDGYGRRIETWLKARARDALSTETAIIAAAAGVAIRSVSIGDADSRWGSCSAAGAIRYSWRLILAPPHVRRFVVAHEVAHRLHMDHSSAFKAAEARLYGGPVAPARLLLRRLSPVLRRVGRD
ncbi:M48 family metallopeptidase [Sphingomonas sp. RB1R13]|uniref:M48 family metallopeptidase n=1 Tax=Sphingomonas sp. RB1R13 TaxID=3096159 RepID=UPI002FC7642A